MKEEKFFTLDEIDIEVFYQLLRESTDFKKLHEDDRRVLIWFIIKSPQRTLSFIDFLGKKYTDVNAARLAQDVEAIP